MSIADRIKGLFRRTGEHHFALYIEDGDSETCLGVWTFERDDEDARGDAAIEIIVNRQWKAGAFAGGVPVWTNYRWERVVPIEDPRRNAGGTEGR